MTISPIKSYEDLTTQGRLLNNSYSHFKLSEYKANPHLLFFYCFDSFGQSIFHFDIPNHTWRHYPSHESKKTPIPKTHQTARENTFKPLYLDHLKMIFERSHFRTKPGSSIFIKTTGEVDSFVDILCSTHGINTLHSIDLQKESFDLLLKSKKGGLRVLGLLPLSEGGVLVIKNSHRLNPDQISYVTQYIREYKQNIVVFQVKKIQYLMKFADLRLGENSLLLSY